MRCKGFMRRRPCCCVTNVEAEEKEDDAADAEKKSWVERCKRNGECKGRGGERTAELVRVLQETG